jgi:hypothetical protein
MDYRTKSTFPLYKLIISGTCYSDRKRADIAGLLHELQQVPPLLGPAPFPLAPHIRLGCLCTPPHFPQAAGKDWHTP